jgi:hypothetical protein
MKTDAIDASEMPSFGGVPVKRSRKGTAFATHPRILYGILQLNIAGPEEIMRYGNGRSESNDRMVLARVRLHKLPWPLHHNLVLHSSSF